MTTMNLPMLVHVVSKQEKETLGLSAVIDLRSDEGWFQAQIEVRLTEAQYNALKVGTNIRTHLSLGEK